MNTLVRGRNPLVVLSAREADVRMPPHVYSQRVPIRYEHPLPYIELVAVNKLRLLYVLLTNPLKVVIIDRAENVV